MCGILGAVDFNNDAPLNIDNLKKGLKAISHRGPDGSGEFSKGNIYLGHNRLSIIDLSAEADQPLKSAYAEAFIIFNGEIYNYKELKKLFGNFRFRTSSDTEVLLEGYLNYGTDFFRKLRGIYSFAIYDNRTDGKVILARDPSGIKPLYLYSKDRFYIFGSEIKALLPYVKNELSINENVVKTYLNLGYCLEPFTIYNEINCVEPGTIVELTKEKSFITESVKFNFSSSNDCTFDENKKNTEEKFKKAVERNLVADVEVSVALSGGIDSSLIYAFANELNSNINGLTVRFDDEEYSEEKIAKEYSDTLKGRHSFIDVETELNLETLNQILINFDQPYADSSAINVYFLTRASGKISKVLIGGDGGDELFNGYPSQTWLTYINRFNGNIFTGKAGELLLNAGILAANKFQKRSVKRFYNLWKDSPQEILYDWHSWFPRSTEFSDGSPFLYNTETGIEFYNTLFRKESPVEFRSQVVFDYFRKQMLSDYLRKTDMMSMLNGVEYRVPLLDEDLINLALAIPFDQKSGLKETKKILRAIHRKKYPSYTSKAPKKGFTIPLDTSLRSDEFNFIKEQLLKNGNIVHRYIKKSYIEFLFKGLSDRESVQAEISRAGIYQRILMLYSFSLWNDKV